MPSPAEYLQGIQRGFRRARALRHLPPREAIRVAKAQIAEESTPRYQARQRGCTCEWFGDVGIKRFDRACPILTTHRFRSGFRHYTDGTIETGEPQ